jgi:uncharacterized membrane protein
MVESHLEPETGTGYVLTAPNPSLSWQGNRWVLISLATLLGVACLGFSLLGLWLVIPFAGLELAVVWGALRITALHAQYREVIRFTHDEVIVQRGRKGPSEEHRFPRAWSQFVLQRPASRMQDPRLVLRSHGREIELGRRLGSADLEALLGELHAAVRAAPYPGPAPRTVAGASA